VEEEWSEQLNGAGTGFWTAA